MKHLMLLFGLAATAILCLSGTVRAASFECPARFTTSDPTKRQAIKRLLPPDDPLDHVDQLNATIDALRRAGLSRSEIINYLIGEFCPVVAQDRSLSDFERTEEVRRFAAKITTLVPQYESELKIIIDVPLKPDVVDEIDAIANRSGISASDWIAKSIEADLRHR